MSFASSSISSGNPFLVTEYDLIPDGSFNFIEIWFPSIISPFPNDNVPVPNVVYANPSGIIIFPTPIAANCSCVNVSTPYGFEKDVPTNEPSNPGASVSNWQVYKWSFSGWSSNHTLILQPVSAFMDNTPVIGEYEYMFASISNISYLISLSP